MNVTGHTLKDKGVSVFVCLFVPRLPSSKLSAKFSVCSVHMTRGLILMRYALGPDAEWILHGKIAGHCTGRSSQWSGLALTPSMHCALCVYRLVDDSQKGSADV